MRNSLPCSYILELVALQIARFAKFFFFLRWASFVCVYVRSLSAINKLHYICINHCVDEKVLLLVPFKTHFSPHGTRTFCHAVLWNTLPKAKILANEIRRGYLSLTAHSHFPSSVVAGNDTDCIFLECKTENSNAKDFSTTWTLFYLLFSCTPFVQDLPIVSRGVPLFCLSCVSAVYRCTSMC